jgi:hypothetical protein
MHILSFMLGLVANIAMITSATAGSAGRCGGGGGDKTDVLECPAGHWYITQVGARGGAFVDEFSIACRRLPPLEPATNEVTDSISGGPGGGTHSKWTYCPDARHAVWIIDFKSGALVDRVTSGQCKGRPGVGGVRDFESALNVGGDGGIPCQLKCPPSEYMYKITIKYGAFMDSIKGDCRQ